MTRIKIASSSVETHMHTCAHLCTCVHTCGQVCTLVHTCAPTYVVHLFTFVHICTHLCALVHTCAQVCIFVHKHWCNMDRFVHICAHNSSYSCITSGQVFGSHVHRRAYKYFGTSVHKICGILGRFVYSCHTCVHLDAFTYVRTYRLGGIEAALCTVVHGGLP